MNIQTGIVGFGKMGMLHGALANSLEEMRVTAITEKSKLITSGFRSMKKDIRVYTDYKKMIANNNLDAIIITTPTFNHFEVAAYAAEKGLSIFLEKPITRNYRDAKMLGNLVADRKLISMVGFCYRFFPAIAKGKEIIVSGVLGNISNVKAQFFSGDVLSAHKGWRFNPEISGGGVLIDFGIHLVDILQWFFGEVKSVKAIKRNIHSANVEDEIVSEIVFNDDIRAGYEVSWSRSEYRKPSMRLEVTGNKGTVILTDQTVEIIEGSKTTFFNAPDLYKGAYIDIGGIAYSLQMLAFYNAMISKKDAESNISNACYVHKIVEAMYKSALLNRDVQIQEIDNDQ